MTRTLAEMAGDEPAHPSTTPEGNYWPGMTKREAFAMAALQGEGNVAALSDEDQQGVAEQCARMADLMLAALHPEPIHPEGAGDGKRRVCHVCHGELEVDPDGDDDGLKVHIHCVACGDSGVLEIKDTDAEANRWIGCDKCHGEGTLHNARGKLVECKPCDGTGYKYPPKEE